VTAMDAQHGQHGTNRLPCCHLAASPASTPWTNSPSHLCPSPTVQRTPTVPVKRRRAVQSAQSMPLVPVHPHLVQPLSSRTPAWHRAADAMPPSPCLAVHRHAPTAHRFTPRHSENCRAPAEPPSHRHSPPVPWTQHTMPPRTAAHGTQWSPSQVHYGPNPADSIKLGTPSGSLPSLPFAPLHSHSSAGPRRSEAEMNPSLENSRASVRSSTATVKVAVDLAGVSALSLRSEAHRHPMDLTLSVSTPGRAVAVAIADLHRSSPRRLRHYREHPQPLHACPLVAHHLLIRTAADLTALTIGAPR
jgi:hypothetical protein